MDTRSGDIYINDQGLSKDEVEELKREVEAEGITVCGTLREKLSALDRAVLLSDEDVEGLAGMVSKNGRKNYMRNKPCVCGSGKKFKKCCWEKFAHANK